MGNANGRSTRVADFDGDGDLDVASSGSGGTQLTWFENMDGQGSSWGTHLVQGAGNGLESIAVADFDGDGDIDLLKGEYIGNLAWHENIDGLGNFGEARIIAPELEFMASVFAADLDNDGDIDVMATHDDAASYWLNIDGQGNFGPQTNFHVGFDFPRGIHAADLDNDTDIDVVVASQRDDAVYWFENLTILGISKNLLQHIKIYPNPAGDTLLIKSKTSIEYTVTIQDVLGRIILEDTNNPKSLDISQLASGALFVTIQSGKEKMVQKIVKK